MDFAREMTGYSLPVLGLARDAIRRAHDLPLHEGLQIEADLSTLAFQTAGRDRGHDRLHRKAQGGVPGWVIAGDAPRRYNLWLFRFRCLLNLQQICSGLSL